MKKHLLWLLSLVLAGTVQLGSAQNDLTVIALASRTFEAGAQGTVNGYITCAVPGECRAFSLMIEYDPAVVQVNAFVLGPYLGDPVSDVDHVSLIEQDAGRARLAVLARQEPTGDRVLFALDVTALAPGTTYLTISALEVMDSVGNPVHAEGVGGIITVEQSAPADASQSTITGITSHSRQIFLDGRVKGNNAHVFENVGDSITYTRAYLSDFSSGYDLAEYAYLEPALAFFAGPNGFGESPFRSVPIAAYGGWLTDDVLEPDKSPLEACRDGEAPLECAYRVNRPAVALIMLGTNDVVVGTPVETYQATMQAIIDLSINEGVIPVISTIPPMQGRDDTIDAYNQVLRTLARANHIPLWDYYSALEPLPNRGLSTDGVHPSRAPDKRDTLFDSEHLQYGYNVRNLGALQVLYAVQQQVFYDLE